MKTPHTDLQAKSGRDDYGFVEPHFRNDHCGEPSHGEDSEEEDGFAEDEEENEEEKALAKRTLSSSHPRGGCHLLHLNVKYPFQWERKFRKWHDGTRKGPSAGSCLRFFREHRVGQARNPRQTSKSPKPSQPSIQLSIPRLLLRIIPE